MQRPLADRSNSPTRKIWLILILLALAPSIHATPLYYTFEGKVTNIINGANDIASFENDSFGIGSSLSYTFLVDFDATGTRTFADGSVFELQDNSRYDAFYADYIAGDKLPLKYKDNMQEYNYGKSRENRVGNIVGGNALVIYSFDTTKVQDWVVGTDVHSFDLGAKDSGFSFLAGNLALTDISDTFSMEVPEPGTLLLFSLGLLGLRISARRRSAN